MEPDQAASVDSLIRSIESNPLDLPVYCTLASVYQSAREFHKAELTLLRAIEIDPLLPDLWKLLGSCYSNVGDWRGAVNAFEQACALDSGNPQNWIGYGMALIATQDDRKAGHVRDTLLDKFPERSEGHLIAGHLCKIRGLPGDAADSYRHALKLDAHQTEALFNLVDLSPPELSDPLTENLEKLRDDPELSQRQSANIRFALARIYERAGLVDRTFSLLREANAAADAFMRTRGNAYDPRRHELDADELIDMFRPEVFSHPLEPLDLDLKMIFIVGLPRSGTTIVERILSGHSLVSSGGELPFMQECLARLLRHRQTRGRHGAINLDDADERRLLERLREEYVDALFERELDGPYVVDKLPANFSALGLIRVLFPGALIIHCTRDPIATCWSLYSAYFGTHLAYYTSLEHLVHYHNRIYSPLMAHWSRLFGPDLITLNYETLVARPETTARDLLNRCGLPWEDACLRFSDNADPIYTASMQQARRPIYTDAVSRWRMFEKHLGPLIDGLRDTRYPA